MSPTTNGKRNFHFQKYNCLSIHPCLGKKHRKIDQRLLDLLDRKSKLETIIETSTVLGGCAIVVLVEFSTDSYPNVSSRDGVLTAYAIVSCLLISVHLLTLLISVCILPEIKVHYIKTFV
ncbi:unnamed protein product [Rotaria magnacalcarata]|uniref:Uncharacterized protein n=1 Tax=Rotaria magnacalcarata TaxID=392030 RepID=A0A815ICC8_9BILA|nr:unnamed protein product [Rotaria magnacalcarata]CAF1488811.1 unnamed protein product [Rotaria magnacalcarata]